MQQQEFYIHLINNKSTELILTVSSFSQKLFNMWILLVVASHDLML